MKKIACLITALMLIVFCFAGCTQTEKKTDSGLEFDTYDEFVAASTHLHPEKDNDLRYALYDKFAEVIECVSGNSDIVIPDTYTFTDTSTGKPVTVPVISIRASAFIDNTTMKHLTIGNNVLNIGENAFANCTALTHVKMSNSVKVIGQRAFSGCVRLTNIVIPSKVELIESGTFSGCESMSRVVVESEQKEQKTSTRDAGTPSRIIEASSFSNCAHLTIMWIPEDVGTVEDSILGGTTPKPLICGGDASASSWFATLQCLDYEVVPRDEFDSHAILYRETVSVDKNEAGDSIGCGNFTITLNDVKSYKTLGNITTNDNQKLLVAYFTVSNDTMISQYFDGLQVKCTSRAPSRDGLVEDFVKMPLMLSSSVLNQSLPVGNISPRAYIEGVVVLRVSERYESVSILFPGADEPFVL